MSVRRQVYTTGGGMRMGETAVDVRGLTAAVTFARPGAAVVRVVARSAPDRRVVVVDRSVIVR